MSAQESQKDQNIKNDENIVHSIKKTHEENLKFIKNYASQIKSNLESIKNLFENQITLFLDSIEFCNKRIMELNNQEDHKIILEKKTNINHIISKSLDDFHNNIILFKNLIEESNDNYYFQCKSLYEIDFNPSKINDLKNNNYIFSDKSYLYKLNESDSLYRNIYGEDEYSSKNEFINSEKMSFLNSYLLLIKKITYQCNCILNYKTISTNNSLEEDKTFEIYPKIKSPNDNDSYLNFIKEIDTILLKKFNIGKFEEERFEMSEIDTFLKSQISKIFDIKKLYFGLDNLFDDSNFHLSDSSFIKSIKTKNDNDMVYIKTDVLYDSIEFAKRKNKIKKNVVLNKPIEEIKRKIPGLNENQLTYLIDCLSNIDKERDLKMEDSIITIIKSQLQYNDNVIHKNILIDFLITTNKFSEFSLLEIISYFPKKKEAIELYDFKIIKDLLCIQVGIVNYIDNRGNLILSGKNQQFIGKDLYSAIPKDWIAIGIKREEKYIKEGWIRCYYSLGNLSSDEIKEKLNKIIVKGFDKEELNDKSNISLRIKNIEENSSVIILDNVQFRILLMVNIKKEVLTKGNKAIFDNEKIKLISILLKKLNE